MEQPAFSFSVFVTFISFLRKKAFLFSIILN